MWIFMSSIVITAILYLFIFYFTYIAMFILYKGIRYKLLIPILSPLLFITLGYISIITDILLFSASMHFALLNKNLLLLALSIGSIVYARTEKGE